MAGSSRLLLLPTDSQCHLVYRGKSGTVQKSCVESSVPSDGDEVLSQVLSQLPTSRPQVVLPDAMGRHD